jgi:hypothetical protein
MSEIFSFVAVEGDEDEEHYGEGPHGGSSIADERKRDADYRHQADGHSDVDEQMHEYAACDAIAIDSGEALSASFGIADYSPDEEHIEDDDS